MRSLKALANKLFSSVFGPKPEDTPGYLSMLLLNNANPTPEFVREIETLKAKRPDLHGNFAGRILEDGRAVCAKINPDSHVIKLVIGVPQGEPITMLCINSANRISFLGKDKSNRVGLDEETLSAALECLSEIGQKPNDYIMNAIGMELSAAVISRISRGAGANQAIPDISPK